MRELRNRVQHDLYRERVATVKYGNISPGQTITSYPFPTFQISQSIQLSEKDIQAIVFEIRAQFEKFLIPYLNNFIQNSRPFPNQD